MNPRKVASATIKLLIPKLPYSRPDTIGPHDNICTNGCSIHKIYMNTIFLLCVVFYSSSPLNGAILQFVEEHLSQVLTWDAQVPSHSTLFTITFRIKYRGECASIIPQDLSSTVKDPMPIRSAVLINASLEQTELCERSLLIIRQSEAITLLSYTKIVITLIYSDNTR